MTEPHQTPKLESITSAASLYRTSDDGTLAPIDPSEAQTGDTAVFADSRTGTYTSSGQVQLLGGEWSRASREILSGLFPTSGRAESIDPLSLKNL